MSRQARTTNQAGLDLIKKFEGFGAKAYRCPAGKWTIGYGHTENARPGQKLSEWEAECLLKSDLLKVEKAINELVRVPVTQNEFDALASFVFNVGISAFEKSTLLSLINEDKFYEAAGQFKRWTKAATLELPGLVNRREAERKLFMTPENKGVNV